VQLSAAQNGTKIFVDKKRKTTQNRMKMFADKKRTDTVFQVGDQVLLKLQQPPVSQISL
jgi:hypothetical protein